MRSRKWIMAAVLMMGLSAGAFAADQHRNTRRDQEDTGYGQRYARDNGWNDNHRDQGRYRDQDDYRDQASYRTQDGERNGRDRQVRNRGHRDWDRGRSDRDDRGRDRD